MQGIVGKSINLSGLSVSSFKMHRIILSAFPPYRGCMSQPRCSFDFCNIPKVFSCPRAFVHALPPTWTAFALAFDTGGFFLTFLSQLKRHLLRYAFADHLQLVPS